MAQGTPGRPMQSPPRQFDDSKLEAMTEPLTVRVERIKGGARTPIPLPESEEGVPAGTNFTKDHIRSQLEQWLVTQWSGGGLYDITVTDSTTPTPLTMKWSPFWDPKQYPELVPPPLASAMNESTTSNVVPLVPSAPSSPFTRSSMPPNAFPNGLPPQFVGQQLAGQQYSYPPLPAAPPVNSPAYPMWVNEAERRKAEDELARLREQNAQREREAAEARHKAELDRIRVDAEQKAAATQRESDRRFNELQETIRGLTAQLTAAQQRPQVDPQLEALKEQNRQLAEKAEAERREREAERRDAATREMIKSMSEASERRMEAMQTMFASSQQQMQTLVTQLMSSMSNKPDALASLAPFITMMQDQARQNADAIKEVARQNTDTIGKLQSFMMRPQDMIAMARDTQQAADAAGDRVANQYSRVIELQSRAVDNIVNMNQGGSQTAELVGMGIEKVSSVVDRWVGGKTATEKFQLEAQRGVAEAQARAIEAQAAVELARSGAVVTPPPPAAQGQLSGPPIEIPSVPKFKKTSSAATEQKPAAKEIKRLGHTDREWFGDALMENVINTRAGVDYFHESARTGRMDKHKVDPKDGEPMPEGLSAYEVVDGLIQAIAMVRQVMMQNPSVQPPLVFTHLLYAERYADFVDVLLPDASQKYRDDVVQGLIEAIEKMSGEKTSPQPATVAEVTETEDSDEDEEGDDEDEDEDAEDPDEDPNDGKVVPKPKARPAPKKR